MADGGFAGGEVGFESGIGGEWVVGVLGGLAEEFLGLGGEFGSLFVPGSAEVLDGGVERGTGRIEFVEIGLDEAGAAGGGIEGESAVEELSAEF